MIKAPELYIFDTCPVTIWEFEHLRWDEWKGKIADDKNKKEKTIDKDDHAIENVGRLLIMEPRFIEPKADNTSNYNIPNYDPYDSNPQ
jgi:CRISPR/Cas system-associated exonuclease Cas4 (RecB family)